jgi:hypothetical protein
MFRASDGAWQPLGPPWKVRISPLSRCLPL